MNFDITALNVDMSGLLRYLIGGSAPRTTKDQDVNDTGAGVLELKTFRERTNARSIEMKELESAKETEDATNTSDSIDVSPTFNYKDVASLNPAEKDVNSAAAEHPGSPIAELCSMEESEARFCLAYLQYMFPNSQPSRGNAGRQLASMCSTGALLTKLINAMVPGTVDERAMNMPSASLAGHAGRDPDLDAGESPSSRPLMPHEVAENMQLVATSARSLGCSLRGVSWQALVDGEERAFTLLALEVIHMGLTRGLGALALHQVLVGAAAAAGAAAGGRADTLRSQSDEELLSRWAEAILQRAAASVAACHSSTSEPGQSPRCAACTVYCTSSTGDTSSQFSRGTGPCLHQLSAILSQLLREAKQLSSAPESEQAAASTGQLEAAGSGGGGSERELRHGHAEEEIHSTLHGCSRSEWEDSLRAAADRIPHQLKQLTAEHQQEAVAQCTCTAAQPPGGPKSTATCSCACNAFELDPSHLTGSSSRVLQLIAAAALCVTCGRPPWTPPSGWGSDYSTGSPSASCSDMVSEHHSEDEEQEGSDADAYGYEGTGKLGAAAGGEQRQRDSLAQRLALYEAAAAGTVPGGSQEGAGTALKEEEQGEEEEAEGGSTPAGPAAARQVSGEACSTSDRDSEEGDMILIASQLRSARKGRASLGGGAGAAGGWSRADKQHSSQRHWPGGCTPGAGQPGGRHRHRKQREHKEVWTGDLDDDRVDTEEERLLRAWFNSLADRLHVSSLFDPAVRTGWPLLLAAEAIQPGSVQWKVTYEPPFKEATWRIMSVCNCNQVVDACMRWGLPLVNIGGSDIAEGQRSATLSLVWHMMRYHIGVLLGMVTPGGLPQGVSQRTQRLSSDGGRSGSAGGADGTGCEISPRGKIRLTKQRSKGEKRQVEEVVLRWANDLLAAAGHRVRLSSLADPKLGDGQVLLQLLAAIRPDSVNSLHVLPGRTVEERESNARYVVSIARKLGCAVFLVWEDIVECKAKSSLMLLASMMVLDMQQQRQQQPQDQDQQQQQEELAQ